MMHAALTSVVQIRTRSINSFSLPLRSFYDGAEKARMVANMIFR